MHKGAKTAPFRPECMYTNAFYLFICNYPSLFFIQMSVCTTHQNTEFTEFLFLRLVSFRGATDWVHSSAPTRTSRLRAAYTESYLEFSVQEYTKKPSQACLPKFAGCMAIPGVDVHVFLWLWRTLMVPATVQLLMAPSQLLYLLWLQSSLVFIKAFFAFNILSTLELYKT